jgi:signal transduction histidine kinase
MGLRGRLREATRGSARLRLTLVYSGMFLLLGTVVVIAIFAFTSVGDVVHVSVSKSSVAAHPEAFGAPSTKLIVPEGVHQQRSADLARLLTASWLVLVLTAIGSAILGWFIAGRVLRPLQLMTDTAHTISATNLGDRLALKGRDDEFKRLGDTLDELLSRLQGSFESQRRFVANAAHELRTPLTVDRALLQVALANPNASAEQLRVTCEELLGSSREQERLLEALLTLASSQRGLEFQEPVDLAAVAARAAHALGVDLSGASLAPAPTSGDPALLERLVANLIDNAVRHNDERGVLEISTGSSDEEAWVRVENTGAEVVPWAVERLFEAFRQSDGLRSARGDGRHGLGLSIVRSVVEAHGGRIEAQGREGGGLAVRVLLPQNRG